ncbi:hypothetical protein [Lysinibacillus fusiformis]|uniref:hypothetical protein n=1 Tax=Lysinibacillus fusiformis TaxID=28031 RepID=UPI00263ABCA6|nr:hypothetical protein [Lysinibacillus fusiformis]MDC6267374.1 hypothetical protein [Lysinibacillus sphaericus]MDN4968192.1 hypothetical protein [Lysinibacillus fusiformis]MDN4968366.1 hypothetical protein [Lysinibacillus fusiformis]
MAVQVEYVTYNEIIQSAKLQIDKDIYQVITPTIKKLETNGNTEIERYVEIAIHDERLSNVILKKYSQKEILEYIRLLQRMAKEITSDEV